MKQHPLILALVFSFVALLLHSGTAHAQLSVASPFTDSAVLQRDSNVPVWGNAAPDAMVAVDFGEQHKSSKADADGKWQVQLDPMPANADPQILKISDEETTLTFENVVVGEVWICSGQSNMQMEHKKVPEVGALVPSVENVRTFQVENTVSFTPQDRCNGRWKESPPSSAVALAFAYSLEESIDVPVGIILASWGSSSIEAWMPRDMTETVPHFKTMMDEFDADTETRDRITAILDGPRPWKGGEDIFLRRQTNILYNAMIHPLVPYACRGLVWYQGERNTQSMRGMLKKPWYSRNSGMLKYGGTLTAWIERYRQAWDNDEMHFMIVMLPGFYKPAATGPKFNAEIGATNPTAHSWAWMRESQLKALQLPHASVVNTIDLGDRKNIHPKDKLPIGQRLALLAMSEVLAQDVVANGPMMQRVEVQANQVVVHFENSLGLKTTDDNAPAGFWLANDDGNWFAADAELDGETVVLTSADIKRPLYIRYAFSGKPNVNLVNEADLPAFPFRTDSFDP